MNTELRELKDIFLTMDKMIGYWLDGVSPDSMDSTHEIADYCYNRALEIFKKIEKEG